MAQESILIADDERFVREVCARAAREDGYLIRAVASGQEAVQAASEQHFDLLLTDLRMPGMSGLDAYGQIVEMQPEIIGVAMTGYATMEAAIQALQLGFHDFILKPFSPNDVRLAISRALERRRLRRENARLRALIPFYQLTRALMTITSLDDLLDRVMALAIQEGPSDMVGIFLLGELGTELTLRSCKGRPGLPIGSTLPSNLRGFGRAFGSDQPQIWTQQEIAELGLSYPMGSLVSIPLVTQGQLLGAMAIGRLPSDTPLGEGNVELLSVLSGQAAVAIKNAQLFQEIQRAYDKVEESDYLKTEFIAIASHELRTPLVSILGYLELLTYSAEGDTLDQLTIVLEQALRLRDVVNDMLSLTDLQSGMAELIWSQVPLEDVIRSVARNEQAQIEAKGARLSVRIPDDCATIRADYERIRLITAKLVSNAIKFSPRGGEVTITASRDDTCVVLSISDHGPGIGPEAAENLFKPFYQVEESLRRSHGGMGLGLAIAKGMVELHGGEIWVESVVGEGSSFRFSVPQPPSP